MPKRKQKTEYPALVLTAAQVAQILGRSENEVRKRATEGQLPGHKTTPTAEWEFFLPEILKHYGGNFSLTDCLAFVTCVGNDLAFARLVYLENEVRRANEEAAALREKLQTVTAALAT